VKNPWIEMAERRRKRVVREVVPPTAIFSRTNQNYLGPLQQSGYKQEKTVSKSDFLHLKKKKKYDCRSHEYSNIRWATKPKSISTKV